MRAIKQIGRIGFTLLIMVGMVAASYAQVGGPDMPVVNSTHIYTVGMDNGANIPSWYIYPEGTNIFNVKTTPITASLGAGTKLIGVASIPVFFASATFTVGTTYVVVYNESAEGTIICENYRFYNVTIQPVFDVDITTDYENECPIEPESFRLNPTSSLEFFGTYTVDLISTDYEYPWNFSFRFTTLALEVGYANAVIQSVVVSGNGPDQTYTPNDYQFENVVEDIPALTTRITFTVHYTFTPGSEQQIKLAISGQKGSFNELDVDGPLEEETHKILRLPGPSALTAVD
jgi:hypothetical protein